MTRLHGEQQRLYGVHEAGPAGHVRAAVLELVRPSGWTELARVWQGAQAELDLPPPGIAVNGRDGYQLWFAFAAAVPLAQAQGLLERLRGRYLADVPPERVRTHLGGGGSHTIRPLPALPPVQIGPERWSAFLAPDLAPVFADEPWLDHPPGADAQAELLARLQAIPPEAFGRAMEKLQPVDDPAAAVQRHEPAPAAGQTADPRAFLLSVMQDPSVDLRLRIEAAKALLAAKA